MEDTSGSMDTINTLWLKNIYENLKNLEHYERLARNGCTSTEAYAELHLEFPPDVVQIKMNDIRFQNMKNIVGEMHLLLTDLTPVLDKKLLNKFHETLDIIEDQVKKKHIFVIEARSITKNKLLNSELTEMFYKYVDILARMRQSIIKDIESLLFTKDTPKETTKKYDALRAEYG